MCLNFVSISTVDEFSAALNKWFLKRVNGFEICLSHCKILDQAKISDVSFLEHFKIYIRVIGIIPEPRNLTENVLAYSKIHVFGTSEFVRLSKEAVLL